ncbi:MAG: hypothetical protein OEY36_12985 [Gammaproteobacteria bacterium]|nr:hypothetical protein [Gammaproteobacteria bacterium]
MTNTDQFTEGSRVKIASTGHVVTIQKISGHGIVIVEYDFGYRRMLMIDQLIKETSSQPKLSVAS